MTRIYRRKTEVLLVVEEIILEIVFMLSVIINRYRNMGQFRGLNVENVRRYRMADRIPQQIEHMSPMESGNAEQVPKPLRNRTENGRRSWSVREEQVLAESMKKIVLEGWKIENGFKIGYLNQLSMYMKQVFPNTDLKPEPHINSRITVWKRNYHSLFEILKNTGVGLDSTTKMIEATDEQWDAFMKVDPNARLMRSKSWPLYDNYA
ncbi:hypothetical protein ACS0TY_033917 [Phlomoides rotata]